VSRLPDGSIKVELKPVNSAALATYAVNLQQIQNLCRLRSIACYAILQPTLLLPRREVRSPKLARAVQAAVIYHRLSYESHIQLFEKIYETEVRLCGENRLIDGRPLYGDEAIFFDQIHLTAKGCRRLAAIAAGRLAPSLEANDEAGRKARH